MILRPYYYYATGCATYLLGCGSLAKCAVVDAHEEDIDAYAEFAASKGMRISLTVAVAHTIVTPVEHQLQHHLKFLSGAVIHVDPATEAGEARHQRGPQEHDGLESHAH